MADMESLEDMLAALEGPSGSFGNDLDNISNIDDFLDKIEEEARMSTKSRQPTTNIPDYYVPPSQRNTNSVSRPLQPQQPQKAQVVNLQPGNRNASPSYSQQQAGYGQQARGAPAQQVRQVTPSNVPKVQQTPSQAQFPKQNNNNNNNNNMMGTNPKNMNTNPGQANRQGPTGGNAGARPMGTNPQNRATPVNTQQRAPQPVQDSVDLQSMGYEILTNRGKWINYMGGKASDFRIKGTTSTRVGLPHIITLRALDDSGQPARIDGNPKDFIGVILTHLQTGNDIQCFYRDGGNCEYDLAFVSEVAGSVRMEIKLAGNPMFDLEIHVEDVGNSVWVAKPRLPAKLRELFVIDIVTIDGSRPEGVAPFEVQTVGSVENLRLTNNGDGTYRFQCIPQVNGHITVQLTLHGQPINNSPLTVQVGERQPMKIKQESTHVETLSDTRPTNQFMDGEEPYDPEYDDYGGYQNNIDPYNQTRESDVSNEDLNRLLDELGG